MSDPVAMSKNQMKKLAKKQHNADKKSDQQSDQTSDQKSDKMSVQKSVVTANVCDSAEALDNFAAVRANDIRLIEEAGFRAYQYTYSPDYPGRPVDWNYKKLDVEDFNKTYFELANDAEVDTDRFYVIGRVSRVRGAGSKLSFIDLRIGSTVVQMKLNRKTYFDGETEAERESRFNLFKTVTRVGDICGFAGHVGRTTAGELSIYVHQVRMLTPCVRSLPPATKTIEVEEITDTGPATVKHEISGLTNTEVRFRMRELDMIVNPSVYDTFKKRSKILLALDEFLQNELHLLKVDTPIMTPMVGGAVARPFKSYSNDYACDLFLRISPELYLKRLIVAGFPGVYEIGRVFRNECNDLTHNSEFTSLEYYAVNVDYIGLMEQCEELLKYVVTKVNGSLLVEYNGKTLDFTPPFKRLDMLDALAEYSGIVIPDDLNTDEARSHLDAECTRLGVECGEPRTSARLLDKLVGHFVEPHCVNPTFISGHPIIMSPLAKPDRNGTQRTERFELFVNCTELTNAYTELNNPELQKKNFQAQAKAKAAGDDEAMDFDPEFIESLEYGLAPVGGFGLGVDRLVMFLTNNISIRETILFPTMKPGPYSKQFDKI